MRHGRIQRGQLLRNGGAGVAVYLAVQLCDDQLRHIARGIGKWTAVDVERVRVVGGIDFVRIEGGAKL